MTSYLKVQRSRLSLPNGSSYSYVHISARESKPTFLLLHGYPMADLTAYGYGVIAPDLLGYGDTDKPEEVGEYAPSGMTEHVVEILRKEKLTQGSALLSCLWHYYLEYLCSLVFMAIPFQRLTVFGYPVFGYWYFFNEPEAASIIRDNLDSYFSLTFQREPDQCLEARKILPLPSWISQEECDIHGQTLQQGGFVGPLNWHKQEIRRIHWHKQSEILADAIVIDRPVIFIAGELDAVGLPEIAYQVAERGRRERFLPDVQVEVMQGSGHWLGLEKPSEVFQILHKLTQRS
ncbi:alpha/beta-hydrolase [Corynespora cassiicola Philippines]|uniref:Alpha/beta-hydrolase n=1 Tax=Corynespora cassiicola Philippines TaxID=1448308 RepID=A0A2T2N866_CORCC|nr:alpha/beta-hydrolase [Corynespora cassiicola Philippines]